MVSDIRCKASPRAAFQINQYALSTTLCNLFVSVVDHGRAAESNSIVPSTVACTISALVFFGNVDFHSQRFTLSQVQRPRLIRAALSSCFPILVSSIWVLFAVLVAKHMFSSFPSWHFFSNCANASLTAVFPSFNSVFQSTRVESSANSESVMVKFCCVLLLVAFRLSIGDRLLPGRQLHSSPHSSPFAAEISPLFLWAILIACV